MIQIYLEGSITSIKNSGQTTGQLNGLSITIDSPRGVRFCRASEESEKISFDPVERQERKGQIWKKFAQTTTGHGFARMMDRDEPCRLRIFWALVVILLTAGLLTSVSIISYESLFLKGLQREFIVQHNDTMRLPDIHICDTSLFNRTVLQGKSGIRRCSSSC